MFRRARSKDQIEQRKNEIISAMDLLYEKKELNQIYLKDVADKCSISRSAIYSYYKNKEEILIDSLNLHYAKLNKQFKTLFNKKSLSKEELIEKLTKIFIDHKVILKLMSSNLVDIEKRTTLDKLIAIKQEFKIFQTNFYLLLEKNFNIDEEQGKNIFLGLVTSMYGFYPLSNPTKLQIKAMQKTGCYFNTDLNITVKNSLTLLFRNLNYKIFVKLK